MSRRKEEDGRRIVERIARNDVSISIGAAYADRWRAPRGQNRRLSLTSCCGAGVYLRVYTPTTQGVVLLFVSADRFVGKGTQRTLRDLSRYLLRATSDVGFLGHGIWSTRDTAPMGFPKSPSSRSLLDYRRETTPSREPEERPNLPLFLIISYHFLGGALSISEW